MKLRNTNNSYITISTLAITAMLGLVATTCKKIEPERLVIVRSGAILEVTQTSCVANATLFDVGPSGVSEHGFCYSLTSNPTDILDYTRLGPLREKGGFEGAVDGLTPGTTYYIWAYATDGDEILSEKSLSFDTRPVEKPSLDTKSFSNVSFNSAQSGGLIISNGGAEITAKGVCWNTSPTPTTAHPKTEDGSGSGEFGSDLTGLEPDTPYYIRAYAINSAGTGYGNELSFTTTTLSEPVLPQLSTNPIEEVTWNSAIGGGNISSDGGSEITERGLCWGLSSNPSKSDYFATSDGGSDYYSILIQDLTPETEYFIRAYAINSVDIAYGNEQVFSTFPAPVAPVVVTGDLGLIEPTSAIFNVSSITSDGGAPIISKGLCWSNNPNPTIEDTPREFGNGPDPFSMEIPGLNHDTYYYVRAYATNSENLTGYGDPSEFRTLFLPGAMLSDPRDMQEYPTVGIGDQIWMAGNLNVGNRVETAGGQFDNGSIEKYCYGDDPANCNTYGGQYTWNEMMQYNPGDDLQGVCPDRWHIPTDEEWKTLEAFLGMTPDNIDLLNEFRGSNNEGGMLKATETPPWDLPNDGATNSTGFSALPSGMVYNNGVSESMGYFTVFWTSTPSEVDWAFYRMLVADDGRIGRYNGFMENTTPVRCVKD